MSKIWLDVTTILAWQRPAVGIIRVEAECASHALQVGSEQIHFCRFEAGACYLKVDPADVRAALDRIHGKQTPNTKPATITQAAVSMEERLKAQVLRLINLLPNKLRVSALNFVIRRRGAFGPALRGCRELRHAFRIFVRPFSVLSPSHQQSDKTTERPVAPFGFGDVYLSLGLDWDQKDLVYLYEQKRNLGFKTLLFCYDVIPVKLPHLCVGDVSALFARYFANVAWCADEVLCISECSKRDLQALLTDLGTPIPPMSVVKLGCQLPTIATELVAADVEKVLGKRYILFVSTIERRKNHETLYRAYTRLLDQGENNLPLLVFVGMPGWGINELLADLRLDPRTKNLIKVLNHVDDADLARLYQNAFFTVYPSLYEGWGLPVAESLAAGKFCLASNAASIPEVGGDLIEYLDPWDVPKWADRLKWYFDHPESVAKISARIANEYKSTPWEDTAVFVLEKANRLAANPV